MTKPATFHTPLRLPTKLLREIQRAYPKSTRNASIVAALEGAIHLPDVMHLLERALRELRKSESEGRDAANRIQAALIRLVA